MRICGLIRGVASLEGNNLVVFYYFSASEIWPDWKGDLIREGLQFFQIVRCVLIIKPDYISELLMNEETIVSGKYHCSVTSY